MAMGTFRTNVVKALDGHYLADFVDLNSAQRTEILNKTQLHKTGAVIDFQLHPVSNTETTLGHVLRSRMLISQYVDGSQIVKEARKIFYGQNTFSMASQFLAEFLAVAAKDRCKIRSIIVQVSLQHPDDAIPNISDRSRDERMWRAHMAEDDVSEADFDINPWAPTGLQLPKSVQDLRHLLTLNSLETIVIEVVGGGAQNGSDLRTQLKVREISGVVKRLMEKFGVHGVLKVQKSTQINQLPNSNLPNYDITEWWVPPSRNEREEFLLGRASFGSTMRIQMEAWTQFAVLNTGDAYFSSTVL